MNFFEASEEPIQDRLSLKLFKNLKKLKAKNTLKFFLIHMDFILFFFFSIWILEYCVCSFFFFLSF